MLNFFAWLEFGVVLFEIRAFFLAGGIGTYSYCKRLWCTVLIVG